MKNIKHKIIDCRFKKQIKIMINNNSKIKIIMIKMIILLNTMINKIVKLIVFPIQQSNRIKANSTKKIIV